MDIKALQLCSHFAYQPNFLGYCGRETAQKIFQDCIVKKTCQRVEEEVSKFLVLNPYIQTIAQVTGKDPFSYEVIEAYWLGNNLLKKIKREHYQLLINNLQKQGVPSMLLQEIEKNIPSTFVPVHLFNILHVGVGKATMAVPFNLNSVNNCMIRWGKIKKVYRTTVDVELISLNRKYNLVKRQIDQRYDLKHTGTISKGNIVFSHWGSIVKKATVPEIKNIEYWTNQLLESLS